MRRIARCTAVGMIALVGVVASSCAPKSHEDRVAELRSYYSARLNGFILEEEPLVMEVPELEAVEIVDEEVIDGVAVDEGEEATFETIPEVEVQEKVRLDILIQHRSQEPLPGITVDISMVDAGENEKGHWRVWFDTSKLTRATVTQFTHILEDVGYEEGDGFFVEVRHPVPAAERSEYREFSPPS